MWLSVAAGVVGLVGVAAWVWATRPANRSSVVTGTVVLVVLLVVLVARRTWLDPQRGQVVREVLFVWRRPVAWADAERVRLSSNRGGQLLLEVRGADRRTSIYLPLVAVDLGGDRSQAPELLRLLADQVETWAPTRSAVVSALRAQADHLAGGGSVRESPLARRYLASPRGR